MEVLLQNNLDLPKIREEDGCFRSAFKREKCLKKISSGLKEFKKYLVAVERTFATEGELSVSLQRKTEYLAVMVKLQMKNPSSVPVTDEEAFTNYFLPKNPWLKKVVTRLILRDFTLFIEKTIRAIRFLSTRRNLDI
uniref:Interleukin-6 n=1 Tax=Geotrypetes seraphini TaxID=260995 RepID=A0A6P8PCP2_GEOSA|nr:interleukin-6 [Geotrypetes seraphini]